MNKKNILTAAVSLSLVACLSIGATLAYFTDKTETKTNTFTSGKVDITLVDTTPEHDGWKQGVENEDGTGLDFEPVMPGDTLSKHVAVVVEETSQPAYVAIKVKADVFLPYGDALDQADTIAWLYQTLATANSDVWYMDIEPDFSSAVFYCKNVVNPGEEVTLLDSIKIPEAWDNTYADMDFSIEVQAAAVQAENVTYDMFRDMKWDNLTALN